MVYRVGIVGSSGIVINTPRGEPSPPLDREVYPSHVGSIFQHARHGARGGLRHQPGGAGAVQVQLV